jgi:hypothetical protein
MRIKEQVGEKRTTACTHMYADCLLKKKKLTRSFNFTLRYIDDVLSLNNSRFSDFVNRIYPNKLEIKDTTDTEMYVSYLDLHRCWNVATYKGNFHNGKIEIISFVVNVRS